MPNIEEKDFHPKRNDDEWRRQVETLLATGNAKFHFQKVNGELRDMYCTLNPNVLPETTNSELSSQSKPGILVVWDIEKEGWRSIKYESVIGFKFLGEDTTDPERASSFTRRT
tara:strand:+ start:182 stop:520 length:339 start_codon:yes stop_codon:yes gene_type:complete